mmetsp:Transcript_24896/g.61239  ORF Transcript_24896/g.61239 Transcript_24896/m.61239 type:complete len:212 (-) Transcript_24896:1539-2174(-)
MTTTEVLRPSDVPFCHQGIWIDLLSIICCCFHDGLVPSPWFVHQMMMMPYRRNVFAFDQSYCFFLDPANLATDEKYLYGCFVFPFRHLKRRQNQRMIRKERLFLLACCLDESPNPTFCLLFDSGFFPRLIWLVAVGQSGLQDLFALQPCVALLSVLPFRLPLFLYSPPLVAQYSVSWTRTLLDVWRCCPFQSVHSALDDWQILALHLIRNG